MKTFIPLLIILFLSFAAYGQGKKQKLTISGTVYNSQHIPVEGAVIFIDKVKTSVVTDQQGHYKIKVKSDAKEILAFTLFSGVSEMAIEGREEIDFVLSDKPDAVDEPATSRAKPDTKSNEKKLGVVNGQNPEFASYQSIYDMIRGRFAGVEVTGQSIKVAGSSSLNVSTEPLFVVDGIIVNSIENISPQTVKTIEVLKGPDASIYGMRGANGVIVITLLTGKD